jgi:hypothetical protein
MAADGCLCKYFDLHKCWADVGLNGPVDFFLFLFNF